MPEDERPAPTPTPPPASDAPTPASDAAPAPAVPTPSPRFGSRRVVVALGVIAIVALAIVLGVAAYQRTSAQAEARDDIDRAMQLIERTDTTIRRVDDIVRAQADASTSEETEEVLGTLPRATRETSEAIALLEDATPRLAEKERPAAVDAVESAQLRYDLLDAAGPLLQATQRASLAIGPAEEGWELLLKAEESADRAAKLYNAHDKKKVRESRELSKAAAEGVKNARTRFESAHAAMPEAGLNAFVSYCEGRTEVLALADQADAAFLAGDIAKANTISDKYNARERELAAEAKKLPASPAQAINTAYSSVTAESSNRYFSARDQIMES